VSLAVSPAATDPDKSRHRSISILALATALLALGTIASWLAARRPGLALALVLGVPATVWLVARLRAAVAMLVGSFFFDGYLASPGLLSPAKLIGALACVSFLYHVLVRRRPLVVTPPSLAVGAFAVWVLVAGALAQDHSAATETVLRYLMLFVLSFLVGQAVADDVGAAEMLLDVLTAAAGVAAFLGLYQFLFHGAERASGPVSDPNDFAFLLSTVVPVIIYRVRWGSTRVGLVLRLLALVVILACILATFSRGGLVALGVVAVWALTTRRLSVRWAVLALVTMAALGGLAFVTSPDIVTSGLQRKENVAQANIDTRFITWQLAVKQFQSSPIVGVGPGNFEARYWEFALPYDVSGNPPPPHNAYLHVLAELGIPGLALLITYFSLSWRELRSRSPNARLDALHSALAAGLLVALVGAIFLSEQYYAPIWLLPALAANLASSRGSAGHTAEQLRSVPVSSNRDHWYLAGGGLEADVLTTAAGQRRTSSVSRWSG
jgi:putative inorganic carbon (hco3(-)) transporter